MKDLKNLTGAKTLSKNQQKDVLGGGGLPMIEKLPGWFLCEGHGGVPLIYHSKERCQADSGATWLDGMCYGCH